MCYSLQISMDLDSLEKEFKAISSKNTKDIFKGKYPQYKLPRDDERVFKNYYLPAIIKRNNQREIVPLRFNLLPRFSETNRYGFIDKKTNKFKEMSTYNATIERLESAKAYQQVFGRLHCIIPVKGFYEWVQIPGHKNSEEVEFKYNDQSFFTLAGIWDHWGSNELNEGINSCSIITTPPREEVLSVGHDRSPLILPNESIDMWLSPEKLQKQDLFDLMQDFERKSLNHQFLK